MCNVHFTWINLAGGNVAMHLAPLPFICLVTLGSFPLLMIYVLLLLSIPIANDVFIYLYFIRLIINVSVICVLFNVFCTAMSWYVVLASR
jgi:hypothetical protein